MAESVNKDTGEVTGEALDREIIDVSQLTGTDIDLKKVEKEKELKEAIINQSFVQEQLNALKRRELDLKKDMNDLAQRRHRIKESMDKSKYTVSELRQDIKILTQEYWNRKGGLSLNPGK